LFQSLRNSSRFICIQFAGPTVALFTFWLFPSYRRRGDVMAIATQSVHTKELDTKRRSSTSTHFEDALRQKIVGQSDALQALVELHQVFCAGLHSPGRPVGNLLLSGPTGSGKTRIRMTGEGRYFLLEEGTDQRYGARHLKRASERYLICPLARLLTTAQLHPGNCASHRSPFRRERIGISKCLRICKCPHAACGATYKTACGCGGSRSGEFPSSTRAINPGLSDLSQR
jgi:ClpA/ClpB-like protein